MDQKLRISVSEKPSNNGILSCKTVNIREKLLKLVFGSKQKEKGVHRPTMLSQE